MGGVSAAGPARCTQRPKKILYEPLDDVKFVTHKGIIWRKDEKTFLYEN